jgi:hypothetical protein
MPLDGRIILLEPDDTDDRCDISETGPVRDVNKLS